MDPITLRIQSAGLLITSLWDKEREVEARRASKEKHGVNLVHIHLPPLLTAAQASTALPEAQKQKVSKRYVVPLICNIMFAVENRTSVCRAELNCVHETRHCINHVPKVRPLPHVFHGSCVDATGQAWRCPSQPAETFCNLWEGFSLSTRSSTIGQFHFSQSSSNKAPILECDVYCQREEQGWAYSMDLVSYLLGSHTPILQPFFCDPVSSGHNLE